MLGERWKGMILRTERNARLTGHMGREWSEVQKRGRALADEEEQLIQKEISWYKVTRHPEL